MRIPSEVTDQYIYFVAVDATDLKTRETGLSSFTVYRSRDGAAPAAMTTPTVNETDVTNMPGVYELLLDEDMTIGSGNISEEMIFHITHASMAPVDRVIELYLPPLTEAEIKAQVVEALRTDTQAEPGQGAPGATISTGLKIDYMFKNWRNEKRQSATGYDLYNSAGTVVDQKATVSDNGTIATKETIISGP